MKEIGDKVSLGYRLKDFRFTEAPVLWDAMEALLSVIAGIH